MNSSQAQLQAAIDGDVEALLDLFRKHDASLRQRIRPLLLGEFQGLIDEQDILQETYMEAVFDIVAFHPTNSFEGWLFQIAHHNLLDALRGLRAEKRYGRMTTGQSMTGCRGDGSAEDAILLDLIADSDSGPCSKATRHEECQRLHANIARLPDPYRDLLQTHYLDGCDPVEAADRLGCSKGAFFMRRARALKMLRAIMGFPPASG